MRQAGGESVARMLSKSRSVGGSLTGEAFADVAAPRCAVAVGLLTGARGRPTGKRKLREASKRQGKAWPSKKGGVGIGSWTFTGRDAKDACSGSK
mmetsp:Transcript_97344/g.258596  ORF Transcript_97344/g.258596 Transcript_97344/m.258596 type:complete len:95 (+) Transcript_97344:238-522(+)